MRWIVAAAASYIAIMVFFMIAGDRQETKVEPFDYELPQACAYEQAHAEEIIPGYIVGWKDKSFYLLQVCEIRLNQ